MNKLPDSNLQEPVAIVGVAAELPSGSKSERNLDFKDFCEFLLNKCEAYETIPKERLNINSWQGDSLGRIRTCRGAFLKDIDLFDHAEFGISAKDARAMAVSTRKLIELSFLALLDSGINYRGRNVGCYAAATAHDILGVVEPDEYEARGSFAGIPCMVANKISYHLDLRGPSIPLDTACSSSLTALHLAVQGLRSRECESAIVSACQLNLRLVDFIQYSQGSVLAPDGKCKPFDAHADGFSRGEGAVTVVIKLLQDAIRDGDHIYGTILGTGINASGSVAPAYAPVANAQADAMYRAFRGTGRNPRDVDYIEMHATGTAAGDPTEANWVGEHFSRDSELLIGSVKGNIGHLEITAFLASLCKVCAILDTSLIPPNVNLHTLNPAIKWGEYKFRVPLDATPITPRSSSRKLLVSISSSGIGGANGHVVVESSPRPYTNGSLQASRNRPILLVAGGLTPRSAASVAESFIATAGRDGVDAAALSTTCGRRGRQMIWRSYSVVRHGESVSQFPPPVMAPREQPPIVFLFSGQGPQHLNMGRQLFQRFPVFRDTAMQLDAVYQRVVGVSLIERIGLFDAKATLPLPSVWPIAIILPSLAMVQIALYDLLLSIGVRPDVLVGHSAGETSLLYASGAASKEMAMEVAIKRGEAMTLMEAAHGAMAAISCSTTQARSIIDDVCRTGDSQGILEIACYNAPEAVAIAGHIALVDKAISVAESRGFLARKIKTSVAVHSSLMELCRQEYCSSIADVFDRYPGEHMALLPTYSTATGGLLPFFDDAYFWRNSREPVQFTRTIHSILHDHPDSVFVEISPHPVLSLYLQELGVSSSSAICPMRRTRTYSASQEEEDLLHALGQVIVAGFNSIDFGALNSWEHRNRRIELPPYPFVKRPIPYLPERSTVFEKQFGALRRPLACSGLRINASTHPDIAGHIINDEPILPAAGFIEMVLESSAKALWNVKFHSILSLSSENPLAVNINIDGVHWTVTSTPTVSKHYAEEGKPRLHAEGYMSSERISQDTEDCVEIDAIRSRCNEHPIDAFYDELHYFAQYGPVFRRISRVHINREEAMVEVRGLTEDLSRIGNYVIHPAILDACIHVTVHPIFTANRDRSVYYLPDGLDAFVLLHEHTTFPSVVYAHAVFKNWLPDALVADIRVADADGTVLCIVSGLTVARHYITPPNLVSTRYELVYQPFSLASCGNHAVIPGAAYNASATTPPPAVDTPTVNGSVCKQNGREPMVPSEVPHSVVDELAKAAVNSLNHVVNVGHKRIVRILGLDDGTGALHDALCSIFEATFDHRLTLVYIAAVNQKDTALPPLARPVEMTSLEALSSSLPVASIDLVVYLCTSAQGVPCDSDVRSLSTLLLPGGYLMLAGPEGKLTRISSFRSLSPSLETSDSDDWSIVPSPEGEASLSLAASSTSLTQSAQKDLQLTSWLSTIPGFAIVVAQAESVAFVLSSSINPIIPIFEVIPFTLGGEVGVQDALRNLDTFERMQIWFVAAEGINADAARGFTRSLRREVPQWDIGLATFSSTLPQAQWARILQNIGSIPGMEREIFVDAKYRPHVPRFAMALGPSPSSLVSRRKRSSLLPHNVQIDVIACSVWCDMYGVVGRVMECNESDSTLLDSIVVTVVTTHPTTTLSVHSGAVTSVPAEVDAPFTAFIAIAFVIVGVALGPARIQNARSRHSGRVIVTHCDTPIARAIIWLCGILAINPISVLSSYSPVRFASLKLGAGDTVITGFDAADRTLESFASEGTRIFRWSSDTQLAYLLSSDPWLIGEILEVSVARTGGYPPPDLQLPPSSQVIPSEEPSTLFKPDAAYLLVGGIGSLGLHIALWMYQKGARYIVLTSRSGRNSLRRANDTLALRILGYLESRDDLTLQLEQSDAASSESLVQLLTKIKQPVAGCMLLSAVLSDRSFWKQDAANFDIVYRPKIQAFEALESSMDINCLDFLIVFSSISTFGNAGQTNYSAANTVLDGKVSRYRNAFSMIAPAVTDSAFMTGTPDHSLRFQHLMPWAYSASEICACLEDGLLLIAEKPFDLYIPDLKWDLVQEQLGPSPLYDHLVRGSSLSSLARLENSGNTRETLENIIRDHLKIAKEDFSPDVPFTSYGIDSLSAGRLSFALRPFLSVTSMQLLGDISLTDLECRIKSHSENAEAAQPRRSEDMFEWKELNRPGEALVKLVNYGDNPLIFVHGASGNIIPFMPLQQRFTTSLWALQTTPDTPMHSLDAMANFYLAAIRAARPAGPYRLGAYSGTALIAFMIAQKLLAAGDAVVQLAILDHFPVLFASPYMQPDAETVRARTPGPAMTRRALESMLAMYRAEASPVRHRLAQEFEDAAEGRDAPEYMQMWWYAFKRTAIGIYEFMFGLLPEDRPYSVDAMREALVEWMRSIHVPVTLFIASDGVAKGIPPEIMEEWGDFGLHKVYPDGQIVHVKGTHFTMFDTDELAQPLQTTWSPASK
ncbi:ketoacyl-synt-domain-containing protein [Wolfiporia cocos MD-104 SS10]|uniref:Ketoacyl-synt-domain-containing protein n=1 Tax=Wolfiporia cocos (strain MD-104) TaxID=742152 RepID=A0A2H3JIQ4_WOLCO|nr:ketoacyl-synt-domain-containing protein [Wolfiporia cocos MD-104 SS10]